jgi:CRISPR-associated endonuclease/helicase Cas3
MLDVAFVAEALLSAQAPRRFQQALAHTWTGVPGDLLAAWLPFIIATHDLGKISAAFQGQVPEQRERLERQHAVPFPRRSDTIPYHADISAVWLHEHLAQREPGTHRRLVWVLRDAMGGHHGRLPDEGSADADVVVFDNVYNAPANLGALVLFHDTGVVYAFGRLDMRDEVQVVFP